MSPEVQLAIIAGAVETFIAIIGILWAIRRFGTEKVGIVAEANQDNAAAQSSIADAGGKWLENYDKMFNMMGQRDEDLAQVKRRLYDMEASDASKSKRITELENGGLEKDRRIRELELRGVAQDVDLERERALRISAEHQRDELKVQVNFLKEAFVELQHQFDQLKSQLPPNQNPPQHYIIQEAPANGT